MTLEEWRKQKNFTYTDLAEKLDAAHTRVVSRWCKNEAIPNRIFMDRIILFTNGAVMPNDFYIKK
tara:strand:+ start:149 stop:343 length:195 start_codon:yes stop_codon:yes gene_type:complete